MSLMSELEDLGELMATNITAKGVSASASDGLTTLAGKILQISGGGGGGTTIFEDACNSSSGLTNYGSVVGIENSQTSASIEYDSTENAYALRNTGNGIKVFPITALDGLDSFKLTMEIKFRNYSNLCGGLACINASEHTGVGGVFSYNHITNVHIFENNSWVQNDEESFTWDSSDPYYKLELIVDGYEATWNWYDTDKTTLIRTETIQLNNVSTDFTTLSERGYGLDIGWYGNLYSYPVFVKNIKAESLDAPSPTPTDCSQYTTQISNAITYINGSGT